MDHRTARRWLTTLALGLGMVSTLLSYPPTAHAGLRRTTDPNQILPMDQIAPQHRENVAEVIREHSFRQQGKPETFPCNPKLYLSLLNEPALTLALWQDLSPTPARLRQVAQGVFQGTDGNGTTATWEFVLRSPRLHVLSCTLNYVSPRGNAKLDGRIVLIVRSGFFKEVNGESWVQHEIEAYVKIDSRGWKAVAATVRPLIEKLLEDQVQEAGLFVSLMARMVEMYPDWAMEVAARQENLHPETRQGFRNLVAETRRPGAYRGRPALVAENAATTRR